MLQNVYEFREKGAELEKEFEPESGFMVSSQVIIDICNRINELELLVEQIQRDEV